MGLGIAGITSRILAQFQFVAGRKCLYTLARSGLRTLNPWLSKMQRLRITFAKTLAMQYTGHLDLHKTWERTLRRARLPLAYSEGFNPHPKIQLGAALPLGFTSECELVDVWLETAQDLAEARAALEKAAPPGLTLLEVREIPARSPAVQTLVKAAEYRVKVPASVEPHILDERLAALLAAPEIKRVRRGKEYDLRPLVEALSRIASGDNSHTLVMRLAAREGATGRPEEVVEALGYPPASAAYHRQKLILLEE
jgi:radical SAM-linked protein